MNELTIKINKKYCYIEIENSNNKVVAIIFGNEFIFILIEVK